MKIIKKILELPVELLHNRQLIWNLSKNDFKTKYAGSYLGIFKTSPVAVGVFMAFSGIGWASVCALPFAMLSKYIIPGTEGSVMGLFNIFIAGPQVFVCTLVSLVIKHSVFQVEYGINEHYEYTFLIGAACLVVAAWVTKLIKE